VSRPRAGYIGFNRAPAASALNSAASGVWTVREAESLNRAGTWPRNVPRNALLALNFDSGFNDQAQGLTASNTGSGVTRSTAQFKGGTHSLFVNDAVVAPATNNDATTRSLTFGSGSTWDITGADFTVECWVYFLSVGSYAQGLVTRDDAGVAGGNRGWHLVSATGLSGAIRFAVFNTEPPAVYVVLADSNAPALNVWIHFAAVRDGSVFRLYKNGVQVASQNVSTAVGTRQTASGALHVGSLLGNGPYGLSGYLDEVLITTTCLYPNGTTFTPSSFIGGP